MPTLTKGRGLGSTLDARRRASALQAFDFRLHASPLAVNVMGHRCRHRTWQPCLELAYSRAYTRRFGAIVLEQALERAKNEVPRLSEQLL